MGILCFINLPYISIYWYKWYNLLLVRLASHMNETEGKRVSSHAQHLQPTNKQIKWYVIKDSFIIEFQ